MAGVTIKTNDYKELDKQRESWAKQHGIILSMPQFIMFLLDNYKGKAKL